jgi:hypothetical protein
VMGVDVHSAVHSSAEPESVSVVHTLPSLQLVGQLEGGSQVSPGSITPLPQAAAQSSSFPLVHPEGQHPSPLSQVVMALVVHRAEHVAALPVRRSSVQGSWSSHVVGHEDGGSQVSPGSTTPSPQVAEQSGSVPESQPDGQHPSPPSHVSMTSCVHRAVQAAALPVSTSSVQGSGSPHSVGQLEGGSQVSPGSTTPLPQASPQSESEDSSHPGGQHPSPPTQSVTALCEHWAEHEAALPVMKSSVQLSPSSQSVGQLEGGSQVSPGSITPSPQLIEQSESDAGSHPSGQQPSPSSHAVTAL